VLFWVILLVFPAALIGAFFLGQWCERNYPRQRYVDPEVTVEVRTAVGDVVIPKGTVLGLAPVTIVDSEKDRPGLKDGSTSP